ncbi:MAG: hypothetical protein Q4B18_06660 [Bacillota bacterium]|nr:hypothetical protein [Bacillota bacterium]
MESLFLAIVTDDKDYARSLSLAMLNVCRGFIIRIFNAEEFLDENKDFDIVLWDGEEAKEAYGGRIVYLAEKPSEVINDISHKRFCVYKYNYAASMVAAVFEIYEALTGRKAVNLRRQEVRLFAFASCDGGVGCTALSMAIAQELCRFQGKKPLYLSFEELESTCRYFRSSKNIKGAAVYLYELFNNIYTGAYALGEDRGYRPFLEGRVVRDDYGTEAFAPSGGRNPLRELNPDELDRFMASIIDSGRYDVIIMDMGQWLSKTGINCLEMAEKICLVSDMSRNNLREEFFVNHIVSHCGIEIMDKIVKIANNRTDKNDREEWDEYVKIARSGSFAYEDGITKIVLEDAFGAEIGKLAEKLMEPI